NSGMEGDVSFFGLEIQLLRIGNSSPAPQFRIVCSPNTWARAVKEAQRGELTETKVEQQEFWKELADYFRARRTFFSLRTPRPQHWYEIALGRSNFKIALTINSKKNRVGCELYMSGPSAKQAFDQLFAQKTQIESELELPLEWQRLDEKTAS